MRLIEFSVQNFRSIRERETFTLLAEAGKSKPDNVFDAPIRKKEKTTSIRVLKTAVLYGANASGKSNFIKAMAALQWMVTQSADLKVGKPIKVYEPFLLDTITIKEPVVFEITFLLEAIKYEYAISFAQNTIIKETLYSYPAGKRANLFKRILQPSEEDYTTVVLGASLQDKDITKRIFNNQSYLSKFGSDIPHPQLTAVYKFFDALEIWNALDNFDVAQLCREIAITIADGKDEPLRKRLSQLIKVADTRIEEVKAVNFEENTFNFPAGLPEEIRAKFIEQNSLRTVAIHKRYENRVYKDQVEFDLLQEESQGTKVLFALGGIILEILDAGGILFFDELDNSLHPKLCKFIVELFRNTNTNPKGAQLIFATHEASLLDKNTLRKDQIWFVEKDKLGETIIYSSKEMDDVREDTNFENWYRIGKFGATPNIKRMNFIFSA